MSVEKRMAVACFRLRRHHGVIHALAPKVLYDRQVKAVRTRCGAAIKEAWISLFEPQQEVYEAWTGGWRPCVRCYPDFDIATWDRIDAEELAADTEIARARWWKRTWDEVYRRRALADSSPAQSGLQDGSAPK